MKKNKLEFHMKTDWVVKEPIDLELKEYLMLDYFQKLDKSLENKKLYPEFSELSLHLANLQTLIKQNQILDTKRRLSSIDDEFTLYDLISRKIPELSDEKYDRLREIIKTILPQFKKQFDFFKSFWTTVYDSIEIKVIKKFKKNVKQGFFYFVINQELFVFEFRNRKYKNITTTKINLISKTDKNDLLPLMIIQNYLNDNDKLSNTPVFEVILRKDYPMEETLIPIIKRKILSYVTQSKNLSQVVDKLG
jgi:hypothetical protein